MKKFESNRKHTLQIDGSKTLKFSIPIVYYSPLSERRDTCVFLYIGGLGSTIPLFDMMNYCVFDNHYLFSYERRAHGENANRASRFWRKYIYEIDIVVNYIRKLLPNKKIIILGESGGAALTFLYLKVFKNKVHRVICWNMPYEIIDAARTPGIARLFYFFKYLFVVLFGVTTYNKHPKETIDVLTTNEYLSRITKLANAGKQENNLSNVAAWGSFKPAGRYVKNNIYNRTLDFYYLQSGEDKMCSMKHGQKFYKKFRNSQKLIFVPRGYHILFMEENNGANEKLFNFILSKIE